MSSQPRSARIEARISPEMLTVVKRAAEIQGRSLSDFVVAAAQEAARRTIEDAGIIRLSIEDQQSMLDSLGNPPEPNQALRDAFAAYKGTVVQR